MRSTRILCLALAAALIAWAAGPAAAAGIKECLECHGDKTIEKTLPSGKTLSLFVDETVYLGSVHGKSPCTTCHSDAKPTHGALQKVTCGKCHPDAAKSYGQSGHGKDRAKGLLEAAGCEDCHGKHDVMKSSNPKARTFRLNIAAACLRCHKDRAIGQKFNLPDEQVIAGYEKSVHGTASRKSGLLSSAVCPDCHGNHAILPGDQPRSATHRQNIPTMCGKCHTSILEAYEKSVHGRGMRGGIAESPVCTDCHGEHLILKVSDPASTVNVKNVPKTCAACHEKEAIATRYALPKKRFSTYMDSFHGIAVEYGMTKAANCASCHGYHDVLPSSDPASPVNKVNLPKTCGKCHPNAGPNFAKGPVHVEVTPQKSAAVFGVRLFYTIFITALVILFVLHVGMDLLGRRRRKDAAGKGEGA